MIGIDYRFDRRRRTAERPLDERDGHEVDHLVLLLDHGPAVADAEVLLRLAELLEELNVVVRLPDDLVGRGLVEKYGKLDSTQWRQAEVALEGRGLTGRLLTGGK